MENLLNITEIVDENFIQSLQEGLSTITGAKVAIVDRFGRAIAGPNQRDYPFEAYCGGCHSDLVCTQSVQDLLARCREQGEPTLSRCPHTGLATVAIPLVGEEGFWGAWLMGQIRFWEEETEALAADAATHSALWKQAEQEHQVITRQAFDETMVVLKNINELLLRLARLHFLVTKGGENQRKPSSREGLMLERNATGLPDNEELLCDIEDYVLRYPANEVFLLTFCLPSLWSFTHLYGYEASWSLLRIITTWLRAQGFPGCRVYYTGDYQFSLLLRVPTVEAMMKIANQIQNRFEYPWALGKGMKEIVWHCRLSIAALQLGELLPCTEQMILVERAMREAVKTQKLCFYTDAVVEKIVKDQRLELSLKKAISESMRGFSVSYQPIVCANTGAWRGVEALCRWRTEEGEHVPPDAFIGEVERIGLINVVGGWVLETAIEQCKAYGLDQKEGFFLSVNLSSHQIAHVDFVNEVLRLLDRYTFPAHMLNLEFTETADFSNGEMLLQKMEDLRSHGVTLALDDFGKGYSTLSRLKSTPAQYLKADRGFVSGIENDEQTQSCFDMIAKLAHANHMKLIAEGVETKRQLEMVRKNGADYIQGFLFCKPIPAGVLKTKVRLF